MKNNKLADCAVLQLLIFAYFWAIGLLLTGKKDVREWSEPARILYVVSSLTISTIACIGYLKDDKDGTRK